MYEDRWERKRARWEQRMERRMRHHSPAGHAFTGAILIGVGVIFLFGNLGYLNAGAVFRTYWPVIIMLFGVKYLFMEHDGLSPFGFIWLIVGTLFLLSNFHIIHVAFGTIWPLFPIAIGALFLWRVFMNNDHFSDRVPFNDDGVKKPEAGSTGKTDTSAGSEAGSRSETKSASSSTANSSVDLHAFWAHVVRRSNSQEFRGGEAHAFMGACEIDLRDASPARGEAKLDVHAFMGGIEIIVPTDWTVVSRVHALLGEFDDRTRAPKDESKRLIITGGVFMGGIEVRN